MLWSTTTLVSIAALATPASAQDQPVPPDPTATAQESPADPPQSPDAPQAPAASLSDENTIVVTGLRRSLQSARNVKRNSTQIVDAVVAEDIGKLPDITVSDTAARIPGIQVERNGGEASRVLLRGLDRTFYTTTYNGREIFTAETRSVALQDFPAGAISAVEAFKTSTANLVEPGLAGLINVRSRRPFDFRGFEVAGSVWGNYTNQSEDFKPNAQLLLTDRWRMGDGEMGALINFSYTRLHYQDSVRRHGFFVANLAGGRSPDYPELRYFEGDRWRPSVNGALQWRPSPDVELYAEGLWQGYREELTDRLWQQPLWGGASYSNIVIDDQGRVVSGTVTGAGSCCGGFQTIGFQGATKRRTNTYQFAIGGRYDAGPLLVTADLARTDSKFKLRTESVDYLINTENYTVNWYTGHPGGSGPTFEIVGLDFADASIYNYRGFFEDYLTASGKDWQGRLDFEYEPAGLDVLPKIQWGARYVDRTAKRRAGARYFDANNSGIFNIPITAVPLNYQLFHPAFNGDNRKPTPTTWLAPTFDSVWDDLPGLRQFNLDQGIPCNANCDTNDPQVDPARTFSVDEKTLAGYAQLNYRFALGDTVDLDGQIGLRAVRTKDHVTGTLFQPATPPEPISFSNSYTNWLPNLNANLRFGSQWQLRLAATKTITRPLFDQLNPSLSLSAPPGCDPSLPSCVRTGSGGNPFLKPLRSNNYDASLEYYFSRTGFASAAVFQRDMKGFIVNRTFRYPDPDPDTGLPLEITGPVNTNKGRIRGFEAQFTTFFDWQWVPTWARAFGAQANVTYIDPKIDLIVAGQERRIRVPDVSKWTWNLVGMYEAHGLTLRLSYNHRSSYPEGSIVDDAGSGNGFTRQGRGNPVGRLDWSSSYAFNDNLTLFFDWTNILKNPFKSDIVWTNYAGGSATSREIFPMVVRFEESVISGGIRFRFGGGTPRAAAPPPPPVLPPPPPPPAAEPAPLPPPPPPPPPAESGERG
ncbi:MAG TPA: TonB-dependent receptor [Sphingomicrobium sp.]|nr:TonB-dependent receptor [Sphingomicrobium sp.]